MYQLILKWVPEESQVHVVHFNKEFLTEYEGQAFTIDIGAGYELKIAEWLRAQGIVSEHCEKIVRYLSDRFSLIFLDECTLNITELRGSEIGQEGG